MKELTSEQLLPKIPDDTPITEKITYKDFQARAFSAIQELVYTEHKNPIMFLDSVDGIDIEKCITQLIDLCEHPDRTLYDICYAENLNNELSPTWLHIKSGTAEEFNTLICDLLNKIKHNLNAEDVLLRILKKQDNNKKLENYLSDLSIHVAQGKDFTYPVLMNLLVCHTPKRPPLIFGRDLTWKKLFGCVNYLTENGTTYSHHHLLDAGLLRQADGGYLVLRLEDLVNNPILWFKLKNTLERGVLDWDNPTDINTGIVPFFSPEPTPINVKVILVGSYTDAYNLYSYDPECDTSFYIRTDLKTVFNLKEYGNKFRYYIKQIATNLDLLPFSNEAIDRLIRYSCRLAESQNEFYFNERKFTIILREASGIAKRKNLTEVDLNTLEETFTKRTYRVNSIVEDSDVHFIEKQMLLQTDGEEIGQINGLCVIQTIGDDFEYGEPTRVTATIHSGGDGDISDIEHKADLAGQIHTKAMMIINGYLTNLFGAEEPLPVSPNLVFEQSYSEIDGDSASLTGVCAIISALSHTPIKQQYSLTGSLDQFGHVQPVGGLNEKIEGFYRICKIQGITGKQGVLIPASNILSLILSDEVIQAVKEGKFHIYPVTTVDEALEILTGVKAGLQEGKAERIKSIKDPNYEPPAIDEDSELTLYQIINNYFDMLSEDNADKSTGIVGFFRRLFS